MSFVRRKRVNGKDYYYLVSSTREEGKVKKIEHYLGMNPPSAKDLDEFSKDFDSIKLFLADKKDELERIRIRYADKISSGTKDELNRLEEEMIIRYTYDTSRIEGSSLTYKDTRNLLMDGISPNEKPLRDIRETENHKEAYLHLKQNIGNMIDRALILKLHSILKKGVTEDAGHFRDAQVTVGNLVPIKASMIESEINNLVKWYMKSDALHPLEAATVFHCIFERIHTFFDGNGRVGRLLLNFILLKRGYPVIIIQNKNKKRYYNALRRADDGNYLYMIKYLCSELQAQQK
jgi:Fic family protein